MRSFSSKCALAAAALLMTQTSWGAEKTLAEYTAEITQQLQQALSKQDLRKDGALDPFPILRQSGLVQVDDEPLFTGEGGGQNGAFAHVEKKEGVLNIAFSNTWVHRLSSVFCLKSAVEQKRNNRETYFMIRKGQESQCIEVAAASDDMSLDHLNRTGEPRFEDPVEKRALNYRITPEFNFDLSVANGRLKMTPVVYEGGSTKAGHFQESIFIWNRSILAGEDYARNFNQVVGQVNHGGMTPVASIDQGYLSEKEILSAARDVEWSAYGVPSLATDIPQARTMLNLLAEDKRADGAKVLTAIENWESNRTLQRNAADRDQLYGTPEFIALKKNCAEQARTGHYGVGECRTIQAQDEQLFHKRRNNADYVKYEKEMQKTFPIVDRALDKMIVNADQDPSVVSFLIAIQPGK